MRTIRRSTQFKKDFRRELKGRRGTTLNDDLAAAAERLAHDHPLISSCSDHALGDSWKGCRDLHVYPDLVLIYKKTGDVGTGVLELVRLGSHSELF